MCQGPRWPWSTVFRVPITEAPFRRRTWKSIVDVLYPTFAGLDVHRETVVACSRRAIGW